MLINTIPHACFLKLSCPSHWHAFLSHFRSIVQSSDVSSVSSDRNVVGHSCSTVPFKSPWCAFHTVQRYKHSFFSLIADSHTMDVTHFLLGETMYNSVVQQIAHHVERQDISVQVHHSDVRGQSGLAPVPEPHALHILVQSGPLHFVSLRHAQFLA